MVILQDRGAGLRLRILRRVVYQLGQELDQHPAQQRRRGHRGPWAGPFVIISGGIDLAVGSTMVAIGAVIMVFINQYPSTACSPRRVSRACRPYAIGIVAGVIFGCLLGGIRRVLIAPQQAAGLHRHAGHDEDPAQRDPAGHADRGGHRYPAVSLPSPTPRSAARSFWPILYWLVGGGGSAISCRAIRPFGRHVYAVGSNERTARLSGVNVERVKGLIYVLMGALVAVTAVIQVSRIGSMDLPNAGSGYGDGRHRRGRGRRHQHERWPRLHPGHGAGHADHRRDEQPAQPHGVPPFLREAFKGFIVIAAVLLQKKEAAA